MAPGDGALFTSLCFLALASPCAASPVKQEAPDSGAARTVGRVHTFESQLQGQVTVSPTKGISLSLKEVVENAAGPDRSVILSVASSTYLEFLQNWFASVQQIGLGGRVVFIAQDEETYKFLSTRYPRQTTFPLKGQAQGASQVDFNFDSDYFQTIVDRKPSYLADILEMNVTVLFSDMDMVWLKDPYPYFKGNFDFWAMEDGRLFEGSVDRFAHGDPAPPIFSLGYNRQVCTCLLLIRPTKGSLKFVRAWRDHILWKAKTTGKPVHDQPELNALLKRVIVRGKLRRPEIKVGMLPIQHFPSGCLFFGEPCKGQDDLFQEALRNGNAEVVIVHNNWARGYQNKMDRFKAKGLWFLDQGSANSSLLQKKQG